MSGIHTIADLHGRCVVDEITKCWRWCGGSSRGSPSTWLPAAQRVITLGAAICWLKTGSAPASGVYWRHICETPHCANPEHRRPGTKSQNLAAHTPDGIPTIRRARIAMARRAQSAISEAVVQDIRGSSETLRVLAHRHGVSISTASKIRLGKMRAPLFAGASVFALGGA